MTDERQSLPSASGAPRYALCAGSFLAERGLPEATSDDAESGNRVHAALAGESVTLTADEDKTREMCEELEAGLELDTFNSGASRVVKETRLWANGWSGKADLIAFDGTRGLVVDYKTGRGEVEHATGNLQLRALAVLAAQNFGLDEVTVAIVQPWVSPQTSVARYNADDLRMADEEINELMTRVQRPGQPRVPSYAACRYCKAKATCPEALAVLDSLPIAVRPETWAVWSGSELAEVLEKSALVGVIIDAVKDEAKRRLKAGETIPGWTLSEGRRVETIIDPDRVYERFTALGGTHAQFMECVKVTKGALKDRVKAATGTKGAKLDSTMHALLDGVTEETVSEGSLKRIKE